MNLFVRWRSRALLVMRIVAVGLASSCSRNEPVSASAPGAAVPAAQDQFSIARKGDFNGDGKSDLVFFSQEKSEVWIALSTGNTFLPAQKWSDGFSSGREIFSVGDFNGDRRDDLICWSASGTWVTLSTGHSFAARQLWSSEVLPETAVCCTGDFNGDGKTDLVYWLRGLNPIASVKLSTGRAFLPADSWQSFACPEAQIPAVGDFDGDGKSDLISFNRGHREEAFVSRSTGKSFLEAVKWSTSICPGTEVPVIGDFDHDGKSDVACFNREKGAVFVYRSNGHSFVASRRWKDDFCWNGGIPGMGDFNGDGLDDIVAFSRSPDMIVRAALATGQGFAKENQGSRLPASLHNMILLGTQIGHPAAPEGQSEFQFGLYVLGTNHQLWHKELERQLMSGWTLLATNADSEISAVRWNSEQTFVFYRGVDRALWMVPFDGLTWQPAERLGGDLTGRPGACSWENGHLDVYTRGKNDELQHRQFLNGHWKEWETLSCQIHSDPSPACWGSRRVDIFFRNLNDTLGHYWHDGVRWQGPEDLAGDVGESPSACSWGFGHLDIYARGRDGNCRHRTYQNWDWSSWQPIDVALISTPSVCSPEMGHLDIFGRDLNHHLWQGQWTGTWHFQEVAEGVLSSQPGVVGWKR